MHVLLSTGDQFATHLSEPEWQTLPSNRPFNCLVGLKPDDSFSKLAAKHGYFVVNFLQDQQDLKLALSGLTATENLSLSGAPKLKGTIGHIECELLQDLENSSGTTLLGRIISSEKVSTPQ